MDSTNGVALGGSGPAAVRIDRYQRDSWRAWVVVLAAALSTFTCFFVTYSFGTSFNAMAAEFGAGKGATALLFGLVIFFLFTLSLPAGRMADRFGPRPVMMVGTVSMALGLSLTSIIHSLWLGYATYGLGLGVGVACCYVPMMAQIGAWFDKHRAAALGLASAGVGLGTLFGPPTVARLIQDHDWRVTFRILAVASAAALALATALAARAPGSAGAEVPSLRDTVSRPGFRRLYLSGFLLGLGLFVPFVFVVPYAKDHGIAAGRAATLISLLGVGSVSGRLLLTAVSARLGLTRLYRLCVFGMGACFVIWMAAGSSFVTLAVFAVVLGVFYGGYVALSPAVCAHMFGVVGLGGILGALYTSSGVGGLVGPPVAGWLIDVTGDSYTAAIAAALLLTLAAVAALPKFDVVTGTPPPTSTGPGAGPSSGPPNGNGRGTGRRPSQLTVWPVGEEVEAVPHISW